MILNIKEKDKILITQVYEKETSYTATKFLIEEASQVFPFNVKEVQFDVR